MASNKVNTAKTVSCKICMYKIKKKEPAPASLLPALAGTPSLVIGTRPLPFRRSDNRILKPRRATAGVAREGGELRASRRGYGSV